jgi:hypothetical protein
MSRSRHIRRAVRLTGGKIYGTGGAARILKINPNTLRSRMRKPNIPFGTGSKEAFPAYLRAEADKDGLENKFLNDETS